MLSKMESFVLIVLREGEDPIGRLMRRMGKFRLFSNLEFAKPGKWGAQCALPALSGGTCGRFEAQRRNASHPSEGRAVRYSVGPMLHGANSSSPTPLISLFVLLPEATARISSKICLPTTSSGVPSRTTPALMSISSIMCWYRGELVAILIDGAGLQPNTEPRPVVKTRTLAPPATMPVIDTGSYPGVSMTTKPLAVTGSA